MTNIFDNIYFKWLTIGLVITVLITSTFLVIKGVITGEHWLSINSEGMAVYGVRTVATKALDGFYKHVETKTEQIKSNVEKDSDADLANRADGLTN
jgi:hypothetical protein